MKTRIVKRPDGWMDLDDPGTYHPVRRLARVARRARLTGQRPSAPQSPTTRPVATGTGDSAPNPADGLSSLHRRLYDRMTTSQGLSPSEALDAIQGRGWGYGQAASYGHMRAAGATDAEASGVVERGDPALSFNYGKLRAEGVDHDDAIVMAEDLATDGG